MAMSSSVWRKKRAVARNSRLEPRLAAVIDVQRLRLFASGKHLQEISQLCVAVLRHQLSDGEAASPSAGSAYDLQERRFEVGEREGAREACRTLPQERDEVARRRPTPLIGRGLRPGSSDWNVF